jgi:hypothetical protein
VLPDLQVETACVLYRIDFKWTIVVDLNNYSSYPEGGIAGTSIHMEDNDTPAPRRPRRSLPPRFGRYDPLGAGAQVEYLNDIRAAEYLRIPVWTLRTWRRRNQGPPYERLGDSPKARIRYPVAGLATWQRRRIHRVVPNAANTRVAQPASKQAQPVEVSSEN